MRCKFQIPQAEYRQAASGLATAILNVPGLRWKIWLIDPARCEAGGICLFDDERAVQAFLAGPVLAGMKKQLGWTCLTCAQLEVIETATTITHGPIREGNLL